MTQKNRKMQENFLLRIFLMVGLTLLFMILISFSSKCEIRTMIIFTGGVIIYFLLYIIFRLEDMFKYLHPLRQKQNKSTRRN